MPKPTPKGLIPFEKGPDPRRWRGSHLTKELLEVRELLEKDAPAARLKLLEMMNGPDPNIALAAARDILDRTLGKPRPINEDTAQQVQQQLALIFAMLRQSFSPEAYAQILTVIAKADKVPKP